MYCVDNVEPKKFEQFHKIKGVFSICKPLEVKNMGISQEKKDYDFYPYNP